MEQKQLKYSKLMEDLREKMVSGEIQAGDRLPSENELSAQYQVSRQTVRKALSVLQNEGYIYAEHGRGTFCSERVLHTGHSHNIAVVTTYLSDYIFPRVIGGIDKVLTEQGYSIILKNTRNSRSQEARCLEELLQKDIDGIIIEPSKSQIYCKHTHLYEKLEEYGIPYVFIQGCFATMKEKPRVLMDDAMGGYLITKYLIDTGHKSIIGVFKSDDIQGQNRHKGYVKALQEAGITYEPDHVIWFYTEDRAIHPYEAIKQMAESGVPMDGVVCYNDQIAMKVIQGLTAAGKKVPSDVSVTGYDNSYIANNGGLQLTTIVHPQEKLGEMAAELLLKLIHCEGHRNKLPEDPSKEKMKEPVCTDILIAPELVIGNSCIVRDPIEKSMS